jgi:hypothetical protein
VSQLIQIGKSATAASVREMFQRLADREAEEIRRLKQSKLPRLRP